jgi:sporulation-control protein spo0M
MNKYHKIVQDGEEYYRAFNETTGCYESETLTEEELIEQLKEDAVEEIIEVDSGQVERAIRTIPQKYQQDLVRSYVAYLERLVDSLE